MFSIIVKNDVFFSNHTLTTGIYFAIDELCFPDAEWTDYTVTILSWWCKALYKIYDKARAKARFIFMDGDCYIECNKSKDLLHLRMFLNHTLMQDVSVLKRDFAVQLIMAVDNVKYLLRNEESNTINDYLLMHLYQGKLIKRIK